MKKLFLLLSLLANSLSVEAGSKELNCLSQMMWSEARGETDKGKVGVVYTVLNRKHYYSEQGKKLNACQIIHSPYQYTFKDLPTNDDRLEVESIGQKVIHHSVVDPTHGATSFVEAHHLSVIRRNHGYDLVRIGNHVFYKDGWIAPKSEKKMGEHTNTKLKPTNNDGNNRKKYRTR